MKPLVGGRAFPTIGHADGIVSLLFTGGYPALTWVPFVLAGMAVARLDLAATAVRIRLALTGVALAVTGYGGSWLALRFVPGAAQAVREAAGRAGMSSVPSAPPGSDGVFGDTPAGMLVASPHSEATLSIVGNTGVAILVITACLAAMDTFPRLRRLSGPSAPTGTGWAATGLVSARGSGRRHRPDQYLLRRPALECSRGAAPMTFHGPDRLHHFAGPSMGARVPVRTEFCGGPAGRHLAGKPPPVGGWGRTVGSSKTGGSRVLETAPAPWGPGEVPGRPRHPPRIGRPVP
ncbi:hypothetical protein [Streptomyces sp. NPDC001843]|uniref:hypothetical protein n=1 Tax=Streptomyces sp. NPDC001843 TaxID=3364617 RepID=UPI0036BF1809